MQVTENMKIKEVLAIGSQMLDAFAWLAPEFERLKYPKLRKAMSGRVTVAQAARIARVPLAEALYVLNLAAGADSEELSEELQDLGRPAYECPEADPPHRPSEIMGLPDTDPRVVFVDVMSEAERHVDPMPRIAKGLASLKSKDQVLLIHHPFDPIPLRDMFARRGFGSWAEERRLGNWYIYFFRPRAGAGAWAAPTLRHAAYVRAVAAGAF